MLKILDWLELHPGTTWQERWDASGAGAGGRADWRDQATGRPRCRRPPQPSGQARETLGGGLVQLIGGDVLRPGLPWLLATGSPRELCPGDGPDPRPRRDHGPAGTGEGRGLARPTSGSAIERVAMIMAAKGGTVADITPGDCMQLLECSMQVYDGTRMHSPFFYELLHEAGAFPPGAPATVRMISARFAGQLTPGQLIDRYDLACRPVRDLLVDYLRERQPGIDYSTLTGLAGTLGLWFWKDLEDHHPGISSLKLPPDIAAGWKKRIQARQAGSGILTAVRGFYLDLAQWALDEPARWGPWAVPCPIRGSDIQHKKQKSRTKARMDARTRERLPVLPALAAATDRGRKDAAARLDAARDTPPGEMFTAGGQTLRRARLPARAPPHPGSGPRTPAPGSAGT